jgi:uncharacterized protein
VIGEGIGVSTESMILWRRLDHPGHEIAELGAIDGGWRLAGVALVAYEKKPCALEYRIECDAAWQTRTVHIRGHIDGVAASLELSRSPQGVWHMNGAPVPEVQGCIDVDLGFSPATNLLPIRRLSLAIGGRADVHAAWVRFPELTLEVLEQTYTRMSVEKYIYESAGGRFKRELLVNVDGFVLDYPGLWRVEVVKKLRDSSDSTDEWFTGMF